MSIKPPRLCVIDASVIIKYLVPEAETPVVRQLMHNLLSDDEAVVYIPDLLYIECTNVLWKKVQRGEVDRQTAEENLADLAGMELNVTPIVDLMQRALHLACDHGISAYDACYVALAEQHALPLIMADDHLANQLAGSSHIVIRLTSLMSASSLSSLIHVVKSTSIPHCLPGGSISRIPPLSSLIFTSTLVPYPFGTAIKNNFLPAFIRSEGIRHQQEQCRLEKTMPASLIQREWPVGLWAPPTLIISNMENAKRKSMYS